MTLKQYLIIMFLATALCFVAGGFVIYNIDPFTDAGTGFTFFYTSIFLALLGLSSIIAFTIRRFFSTSDQPMFKYVQRSFQDALLSAIFLTALLYLQGKGYLGWWNVGVVLVIAFLFFIFKLTNKPKNVNFEVKD